MVTLQIDDSLYRALSRRAADRGMTVEEWLHREAFDDGAEDSSSEEPFHTWLERFAANHHPTGRPLDDSRESIYD